MTYGTTYPRLTGRVVAFARVGNGGIGGLNKDLDNTLQHYQPATLFNRS